MSVCTRASSWAARSRHLSRPSARLPGSQLILLALITALKQSPIASATARGSSTAAKEALTACGVSIHKNTSLFLVAGLAR